MTRFQSDAAVSADRGHLLTEQPNPRSTALDLLDTADLVRLFVEEDRRPQPVSYTHLTLPTTPYV